MNNYNNYNQTNDYNGMSLKKPLKGRATGYGDSMDSANRGTAATMLGSNRATNA